MAQPCHAMAATRYYRRDQQDKHSALGRALDEAQEGRVELAFLRLRDLHEEFPNDASVIYAEGLAWRDALGNGEQARDCFERAYGAAAPDAEVRGLAACNVAALARDLDEAVRWAPRATQILPEDKGAEALAAWVNDVKSQGGDYHASLIDRVIAHQHDHHKKPGSPAAEMQIALRGNLGEDEVNVRRQRAQLLRLLDASAQDHRQMLVEHFHPDERLALREALAEMDRAIELDKFDAELWNFRAGWCVLLERHEEALVAAREASALRPHRYARPWINKAQALWHLRRGDEAREAGREAARQAETAGDPKDKAAGEELTALRGSGPEMPTDAMFASWMEQFKRSWNVTATKETVQNGRAGDYQELVRGFVGRTAQFGRDWHPAYVRAVAELLIYFRPETGLITLQKAGQSHPDFFGHALGAVLYLIVHAEGVLVRDAVRMYCLALLSSCDPGAVIAMYRVGVLEVSAASHDEFGRLEPLVREELGRINRWLPALFAGQPPVDAAGRERAQREFLWRFSPEQMSKSDLSATEVAKDGACGCIVTFGLLALGAWALWQYFH